MIPIYTGLDQREPICHYVFQHSVARHTHQQVAFTPVGIHSTGMGRRDGSTDFAYSRFLVPYLAGFNGWAIFADGDMLCRRDINTIWQMRRTQFAVMVVKHEYETRVAIKMDGQPNRGYPRKNWSSFMLINCAHPSNRRLLPEFIMRSSGADLHRFAWLNDAEIGELPREWNWLVGEYEHNDDAAILHYTLGAPCFQHYANCDHAAEWFEELRLMSTPT